LERIENSLRGVESPLKGTRALDDPLDDPLDDVMDDGMDDARQEKLESEMGPVSGSSKLLLPATKERNWLPIAIAAVMVIAIVAAVLVTGWHARRVRDAAESSSTPDPYAANLAIANLAMSESSNLAGSKVTYVTGQIANHGKRTVTGVTVQVVFRDYKREVAQSQRVPLTAIRMREPYIDTAPLSVLPLKPRAQEDFRLNFDSVSPDWAGALPEVQVVHVDLK